MWQDFKSWAAQPFSADMSAVHWFLFLGLLIVLAMLWGMILSTVREVT
jgi:hypothetical protein